MVDLAYQTAVKETFETKPLRTVLMIDDEFPTFADLGRGNDGSNKFKQTDRAIVLYEGFRQRQMICDIENNVDDVETDRLRKSDLVVLDYHLGPTAGDTKKALSLLRALSNSKHFNTVVVYTAESDQDRVWLDIIATLTGDWLSLREKLKPDAQAHWDRLSDENNLPTASLDAIKQFAVRGEIRDLVDSTRKAAEIELQERGVPLSACGEIIKAMIYEDMARRAGDHAKAQKHRVVGNNANEVRWIQSRNSFVAVLKKADNPGAASEPAELMSYLSEALLAWRPNLFQILISEIQNILELEALATQDVHLREPVTQTALWYYLLESIGVLDLSSAPDVTIPLMGIVDKIVDGIRRRLSTDSELLALASKSLLGELRDMAWSRENWPKSGKTEMVKASIKLARTEGLVKSPDILFTLNSFFSTERFGRAHLTTGTIFHDLTTNEYFVAASPACDLVARQPGAEQVWASAIHPLTPVVAILLHPIAGSIDSALADATKAQHVFLRIRDERKAFKLVNSVGQPAYEFLFAKNEGRVWEEDRKLFFKAGRMKSKTAPTDLEGAVNETDAQRATIPTDEADERELVYSNFEVVNQLRAVNATRVLQLVGQHLSRIGLDFVNMPTK